MDHAVMECPSCHEKVGASELFCEACGAELSTSVAPVQPQVVNEPARTLLVNDPAGMPVPDDLGGTATTCQSCGGKVASDGYCDTCGALAPKRRDHFSEQPAAWVAAVCDRGIRHTRNEDAVALAAEAEPGSRAVLVVCDGVSNSIDSDVASLAAARAARDVLATSHSRGMGTASSFLAAVRARLEAATDAASEAVHEASLAAKDTATVGNPASCTFVAAVVEQDLLVVGSVGDSRAYWLPDAGTAAALTVDDSFSQEQIASGVPRAEAESGPQSHAITRWLGVDAPDHTPRTATMTLTEPGWLMLCSDGLWNYCSAAEELAALVRKTSDTSPTANDPLLLAGALVDWANAQGGQDNITVALARVQPS
jgi:serine/threonine protein phosphatase PrpC